MRTSEITQTAIHPMNTSESQNSSVSRESSPYPLFQSNIMPLTPGIQANSTVLCCACTHPVHSRQRNQTLAHRGHVHNTTHQATGLRCNPSTHIANSQPASQRQHSDQRRCTTTMTIHIPSTWAHITLCCITSQHAATTSTSCSSTQWDRHPTCCYMPGQRSHHLIHHHGISHQCSVQHSTAPPSRPSSWCPGAVSPPLLGPG